MFNVGMSVDMQRAFYVEHFNGIWCLDAAFVRGLVNGLIGMGLGMVLVFFPFIFTDLQPVYGRSAHRTLLKLVPDVVNGHAAWMDQVRIHKSVISEIVHDKLIGREIGHIGECLADSFNGQEEC